MERLDLVYSKKLIVSLLSCSCRYKLYCGVVKKFNIYELKYIYLERCMDSCRSRAINYGIKMAEGEIIIFIDADIIVKKDYLVRVEKCFSILC